MSIASVYGIAFMICFCFIAPFLGLLLSRDERKSKTSGKIYLSKDEYEKYMNQAKTNDRAVYGTPRLIPNQSTEDIIKKGVSLLKQDGYTFPKIDL